MELIKGIPIFKEFERTENLYSHKETKQIELIKEAVTEYEVKLDLEQVTLLLNYKNDALKYANELLLIATGKPTINNINYIEKRIPTSYKLGNDKFNAVPKLWSIKNTVRTIEDILNYNLTKKIDFNSTYLGLLEDEIQENIDIQLEDNPDKSIAEITNSTIEAIVYELKELLENKKDIDFSDIDSILKYNTVYKYLDIYEGKLTAFEIVTDLIKGLSNHKENYYVDKWFKEPVEVESK